MVANFSLKLILMLGALLTCNVALSLQVFVKVRQRTIVIHDIYPDNTVEHLMEEIEAKVSMERDQYWLVFGGRILAQLDHPLSQYGVQNLSTIFLHERFCSKVLQTQNKREN